MDANWNSKLGKSQPNGKGTICKVTKNILKKNVKAGGNNGSPKIKKVLDYFGQKQCNVILEKLAECSNGSILLNENYANNSIKTSVTVLKSENKEENIKMALPTCNEENSITKENKKNLSLKTNVSSIKECKEISTISYANLPSRVGSFEISINEPIVSLDQCSENGNSDTVISSEKIPRPLSPEVFIKTFDNPLSINKRKQRTPIKADLKSLTASPTKDIENSFCNFNYSKNSPNLDDNDEQSLQNKKFTGNKKKNNNLDVKLNVPSNTDLVTKPKDSKIPNSFLQSKLNKSDADSNSSKRKLQQVSNNMGLERHSKKQKKKMVKFHPNISEVFKSPTDEEIINEGNYGLSAQVSSEKTISDSIEKLLHSRNVQVSYQINKSVSPQKLSVSKKGPKSLKKSVNNTKILSHNKNEKTISEFNAEGHERTERKQETVSPSSKEVGDNIVNNKSNFVKDNDSNFLDSASLEKKSKYSIARMRTAKVVKSILKKKSKVKKENLSLLVNKKSKNFYDEIDIEKSPSKEKSLDRPITNKVLLSEVSSNQFQFLEGDLTTTDEQKKNKSPSSKLKPIAARGRQKMINAKPLTSRPKKYRKKSLKRDNTVSTDTSENLEGSASDTDDNMPIIYFQNAKTETTSEKSTGNMVVDDANLLLGFNELLKKSEGKKKRGRGRKRQKIGRPKNEKVKEEVDADSSFFEDDDEEDKVISDAAQSPAKRKHQKRTGRRYSVTGNWYIATGYLNDLLSLLEDFENCDGWRFKDFAKCWQKKSFSLVFRGRQTFKELLEFSEEIALLTLRFIGPSHSTKRRIGALYTLYGLYYKFPVGHFFKLRFELEEYKNVLELVHPFRSNIENPDPAFIFRKLELKGAILHCATACEPCYDFHNDERDLVDLEYGKQKLAKSSAVNIAIPSIQLEADSDLLKYYHSTKAKLTGKGREPEPERALSLISSEFLANVSSDLREMRRRTNHELGMLNKAPIKTSTHDRDDSNPGDCSVSVKLPWDALITRDATKAIIDTVNKPAVIQKSQEFYKNVVMLRDQSVNGFMRQPCLELLHKPLKLKAKKNTLDVDRESLNLLLPTRSAPKNKKICNSRKNRSISVEVTLSDGECAKVVKTIEVAISRKKFQDIKKDPVEFSNLKTNCKSIIQDSFPQENFALWDIQAIVLNANKKKNLSKRRETIASKLGTSKFETSPEDTYGTSLSFFEDEHVITIKEESFDYDIGIETCDFPTNAVCSKMNTKFSDPEHLVGTKENILSNNNLVVQSRSGRNPSEVNNIFGERRKPVSKKELSIKRQKSNKENNLDVNDLMISDSKVVIPLDECSIPRKQGKSRRGKKFSFTEDTSDEERMFDVDDDLMKVKENQIESNDVSVKPRKRGRSKVHKESFVPIDLIPRNRGRPRGEKKLFTEVEENIVEQPMQLSQSNEKEVEHSNKNSYPRKTRRAKGEKNSPKYFAGDNLFEDDDSMEREEETSDENFSPEELNGYTKKKKTIFNRADNCEDVSTEPKKKLSNKNDKLIPVKVGNQIKYQYIFNADRFANNKAILKKKSKNSRLFSKRIRPTSRSRLSKPLNINDELDSNLFYSPVNEKFIKSSPSNVYDSYKFTESDNEKDYSECNAKIAYDPQRYAKYYNSDFYNHYSPETTEVSNETATVQSADYNWDEFEKKVSDTFKVPSNEENSILDVDEQVFTTYSEIKSGVETTKEAWANSIKVLSEDWSDDESEEAPKSNESYSYCDDACLPINEMASLMGKSGNEDLCDNNIQFSESQECNLTSLRTQTSHEDDLFYKVMSKDGKGVLVPIKMLSQVQSNYIEILAVNSVDLELLAPPQSMENLPSKSEYNQTDKFLITETMYACDSSATQSQTSEPTSFTHTSQFPSQVLSGSNLQTGISTYSANWSGSHSELAISMPGCSGTSVSTYSEQSKIPSLATSSQKCSFFFSSKLKHLSNKKLASGRPPSPIPKPRVKFMFKGKSWSKNK